MSCLVRGRALLTGRESLTARESPTRRQSLTGKGGGAGVRSAEFACAQGGKAPCSRVGRDPRAATPFPLATPFADGKAVTHVKAVAVADGKNAGVQAFEAQSLRVREEGERHAHESEVRREMVPSPNRQTLIPDP